LENKRSRSKIDEIIGSILNMSELEKMEGELMFLIDRVPYSTGESKVEGYKKIESLREEIKAKKRQDKLDNLLN